MGKAGIREALYWPAITAMRYCPACKAFAEGLVARGKAKKVVIGAVMRKLVHICYGVLKHRTPYDPAKAFGRQRLQRNICHLQVLVVLLLDSCRTHRDVILTGLAFTLVS